MSGFTRNTKRYGDQLVYEALLAKWDGYHRRHCRRCRQKDWITEHVLPAGYKVVHRGRRFVTLTGPGLTDQADESRLTANALWEIVTGKPGAQDWFEQVNVFVSNPAEPRPDDHQSHTAGTGGSR